MFRIELWVGGGWSKCGSSNNEKVARDLMKDTAKQTPGYYRVLNPAGKVIDSIRHEMTTRNIPSWKSA